MMMRMDAMQDASTPPLSMSFLCWTRLINKFKNVCAFNIQEFGYLLPPVRWPARFACAGSLVDTGSSPGGAVETKL